MKKKILSLCLVVALAATAIVGGTLAYFTDSDEAENVFQVGNIDIELHEAEETGIYKDDDYIEWLEEQTIMPGLQLDKIVWVENTGNQPAYVRVTIIVPEGMEAVWGTELGGWTRTPGEKTGAGEYVYTSTNPLAAGAGTPWLMTDMKLSASVTELDVLAEYNVHVYVEAIQAAGFGSSEEAYNALDNETNIAKRTTAANADELESALSEDDAQVVTLTEDITSTSRITMTNTDSVLDGSNNAITKDASAESTKINAGVRTNGGTIKNVTITGNTNANSKGFRAIYVEGGLKGDLTIENADLTGVYPLSISGGSTGYALSVKDSKLNGWTSFATVDSAEFTGVEFGEGAGYKNLVPYSSVTLTDCTFVADFGMDCGNTGITIELNNCKVGGETVTAANFATLFKIGEDIKTCTVVVDGVTVTF